MREEETMGLAERRSDLRASCRIEIQCASADALFSGTLLNVSTTGAYLETSVTPPPTEGSQLTLLWKVGSQKVQAEAIIVWSHPSGSVGLRFVDRLPMNVVRDSGLKY